MQSKLNNLLFLIESLSGGGAEKVLTTLLQHLDSNKFDVTLCCIVDCGKYVNDVKPYVHYTSILPNLEQIKGIRKLIYQLKYKLIYSWLPLRLVYKWFVPHHADVEIAFVEGFATKLLAHSTNKQPKKSLGYTLILKNIIGLMLYLRINRMKNRHIADITKLSQFLLLSKKPL